MLRLKKRGFVFALSVFILLLSGLLGTAFAQVGGEQGGDLVVPAEELIDDDYFAAGETVTVKGQITGDMFAVGNNVAADGSIGGDIIAMGRQIDAGGSTGGNIRAAGQVVSIRQNVERSVTVACQEFTVGSNSVIGGNILAAASTLKIDGKVNGTLRGAADTILIAGEVVRNVEIAADHVVVLPSAKIGGNLTYKSANRADIHSGAQINGTVRHIPAAPPAEQPLAGRIWGETLKVISLLALALLFVLLLPLPTEQVADTVRTQPWLSLGLGVGGLLVTPILALLFFITVIGIHLGWLFLIGYGAFLGAGILLGKVFLGFLLGVLILRAVLKKQQVSLIWSVLLGTAIIQLVTYIPYVGWLVNLFVLLLALGALLYLAGRHWFRRPPKPEILFPRPVEGSIILEQDGND